MADEEIRGDTVMPDCHDSGREGDHLTVVTVATV